MRTRWLPLLLTLLLAIAPGLGSHFPVSAARAEDRDDLCNRARGELEQIQHTLEMVGQRAHDQHNQEAMAQVERAQQALDAARRALEGRRCDLALRYEDDARQRLGKALDKLGSGGGGPAGPPRKLDPELVGREIQYTEDLLAQNGDVVQRCDVERARILMDEARRKQSAARSDLSAITGNPREDSKRLEHALRFTFQAREDSRRAREIAERNCSSDPGRLSDELRRTDELLATALEFARSTKGVADDAELELARQLQERARGFFQRGRYEEATRLTLRVRDMLRQILNSSGGDGASSATLEEARRQAETLIAAAEGGKAPEACRRFLKMAEARLARGKELERSGRTRLSLMNYLAAQRLAVRATDCAVP